ncbi:hypothetical protein [Methylocapsa palsarum]|uniref:hypothetical protein n=1 Tax=Methylocapsa palsarum TaxID=1612308 RepID=UPI000ABFD2FC|nr:hypothetical protein [Methylocapsa palsarum]
MTTTRSRFAAAALAALAIGSAALPTPADAQARYGRRGVYAGGWHGGGGGWHGRGWQGGGGYWRGGRWYGGGGYNWGAPVAAGVIGGLALGALAAGAANPYGYAPGYGYGYAPAYGGCSLQNQPAYDGWGNFVGYRQVRVCY